ncbi:MAG: 16S rRNA (adenine(1518)-N(6)/adenine(1519)-N(6))-dimethyltransferase RsmA [Bacteroidales bacterium]|nr:16S rRNA (adenine(1518)-N(6)/adenine(1519)-N(6))-dimethyltransferase RsmA [Bacteroidales bacterium]
MVKAKKHLGQHFLTDQNIARKIVDSMPIEVVNLLEVGARTGVLTKYLLQNPQYKLSIMDVDEESIAYLKHQYPEADDYIIQGDFLKTDLSAIFSEEFSVIGNFPYNISSQIFFKILDHRNQIGSAVGMIQKEVAERIVSPPGSKVYGILSVLLQAFFHIDYLFNVSANVFSPPPKVKSAVIRLRRNDVKELPCNENLFFRLVKQSFNQRRKTLRNSLKSYLQDESLKRHEIFSKRPEQLTVDNFVAIAKLLS